MRLFAWQAQSSFTLYAANRMNVTQALPPFDPRSIPVLGIDDHLVGVPRRQLTASALRERFLSPPVWTPEHSVEKRRAPLYPFLPAVLVIGAATLVIYSLVQRPTESLYGAATVLSGIPLYYFWRRRDNLPQHKP